MVTDNTKNITYIKQEREKARYRFSCGHCSII